MELVLTKTAPDTRVLYRNAHVCGGTIVDIDLLTGIGTCDVCDVECLTFPEDLAPILMPEVPPVVFVLK